MKSFSFLLIFLVLTNPSLSLSAAPSTHDLGEGLSYIRIESLLTDLPAAPTPKAVVLDLRYTAGDESAANALIAWLQARAGRPTLVLVNPDTAASLRPALSANRLPPGTLTIGRAEAEFTPDIMVAISADADRAAWASLRAGTEPATLIADNLDKVRNDEAAIVRRHQNNRSDETESAADPPAPASGPPDRVLQRAVQLHRGLTILGVFPR